METDKIQTIDEIVEKLLELKSKYGNIKVAEILWETADYQINEVISISPCVVTNPNTSEYMVIFD